jgi:hypothetical protein
MYLNLLGRTACFILLSMDRRQGLNYFEQDLIDYVQLPLYDALAIRLQKNNYTHLFSEA